jgi:23S rRNA (adenine2503-C2)-methyltransferase
MDAHVNLIRLNATAGFEGVSTAAAAADAFRAAVRAGGLPCTIRQYRGIDVAAGCGQLRAARLPRPGATAPASDKARRRLIPSPR